MQTIKLGITGGIGSGKSVVSQLLSLMEVPVYISDIESKRLTNNDPEIRAKLMDILGEEVYLNGELNKPLLANYLFASSEHAQTINSIIHPVVKADFRKWAQHRSTHHIVGIESAILFEAGFAHEVDYTMMVYAPLDIRIARTMTRDHSSEEQVKQRIARQMNDEEKRTMADFIITNDGKEALIPQVIQMINQLSGSGKP